MNDLIILQKIRKQAIIGIICYFLFWFFIPAVIWLVFQILLISNSISYQGKNRILYLILSIVGLFAVGGLTDIAILMLSNSEINELQATTGIPQDLGI